MNLNSIRFVVSSQQSTKTLLDTSDLALSCSEISTKNKQQIKLKH